MRYSCFDEKSKYINNQFVSQIKFTVKPGFVVDFLKAQSRADTDPIFHTLGHLQFKQKKMHLLSQIFMTRSTK